MNLRASALLSRDNARRVKYYVKEQVQRNLERFSRPARILRGYGEYSARRAAVPGASRLGADVATLRRSGYVLLAPSAEVISDLAAAAQERLAHAQLAPISRSKSYMSQLLGEQDMVVQPRNVFLRFALDETILNTVAGYLGVAPYLDSVDLLYSLPHPGPLSGSQLWHKDRTDSTLIKILVYLNPVTVEAGPFTLLPVTESRRVPAYLPHYLSDDVIGKYADLARSVAVTGPVGTTCMVDTRRCYHMGSRCTEPRLVYWAYYTTGFGYKARDHRWRLPEQASWTLSSLQRFALGG